MNFLPLLGIRLTFHLNTHRFSYNFLYLCIFLVLYWPTLLRVAIIFLPVCLFFSISSNVHDVSMRFFSLDFLPLRMRLLRKGWKSWKDRKDNRSSWERLDQRMGRPPKAREFANLAKICLGQQLSTSTSILEHNVGGGGIVMESTLRVFRLNHFPMAELTSLRGWFLLLLFFWKGKERRIRFVEKFLEFCNPFLPTMTSRDPDQVSFRFF